jgi:hypothetical protein
MLQRLALFAILFTLAHVAAPERATAQNVALVSSLGAKCMDAEGGSRKGARLIGYACTAASNQIFWFNQNGTITQGSLCLDASGGYGRDGDQIVLWDCNGGANQRWTLGPDGAIRGINGKCMDLQWGDSPAYWVMNQPVILWGCHGGKNQVWFKGLVVPRSGIASGPASRATAAGRQAALQATQLSPQQQQRLIAAGGQNLIGVDAGTLIAAGGQNLIGVDAGTMIVLVR